MGRGCVLCLVSLVLCLVVGLLFRLIRCRLTPWLLRSVCSIRMCMWLLSWKATLCCLLATSPCAVLKRQQLPGSRAMRMSLSMCVGLTLMKSLNEAMLVTALLKSVLMRPLTYV